MPAAAKTATKTTETVRRKIAQTLIDLRVRYAKAFSDIDGLKASLILNAKSAGEGFREVFDGKGTITVACPKDKKDLGELPEVDAAAFRLLPGPRRQKLIADGIIKMVPTVTREFHGRVDIKLF